MIDNIVTEGSVAIQGIRSVLTDLSEEGEV